MVAGDPEAGVSIEAVGLGSCTNLQEEALTAQDGTFRSDNKTYCKSVMCREEFSKCLVIEY
jgi:hypothetical protein